MSCRLRRSGTNSGGDIAIVCLVASGHLGVVSIPGLARDVLAGVVGDHQKT